MFKRILVAIDGSTTSNEAIPSAVEVARKFDSEILVLHVSEHDRGRAVVFSTETPAAATAMVADAVKKVRDAGIAAEGRLCDVAAGHVAKAILETAEAYGTDLIVMGSRGLSDIQALMLGSASHKIMEKAGVPVLVVWSPPHEAALATNGAGTTFKA